MERYVFHVTADNEFRIVDTSDDGKNYLFDDVDAILRLLNDAQATIAALQARVQELEGVLAGDLELTKLHYEPGRPLEFQAKHPLIAIMAASMAQMCDDLKAENYVEVQFNHHEKGHFILTVQKMFHPTPHQLRQKAESQLTQRTAELEAVQRKVDLAEKKAWLAAHDVGFFSMWNGTDHSGPPKLALLCNDTFAWATADAEDVLDAQIDTIVELFKSEGEAGVIKWIAQQRNMKPMESVGKWLFGCDAIKKERDDLRTLILALPKVEGAVVVSNGYVKDSTRCHALFGADEDAASYAALLRERQKLC